jgi:uncharacterized pyridoxal phosphate-containing UPF0001 family protein
MIRESVQAIIKTQPPEVLLVAAAKTRTPAEVREAIAAGVTAIGYNYVQEAERIYPLVKRDRAVAFDRSFTEQ